MGVVHSSAPLARAMAVSRLRALAHAGKTQRRMVGAEIKRRTNVVSIFPNDASIVRLVGAMMREQYDEWA